MAAGAACFKIAQEPATCGVAMDVPLSMAKPPPVTDERMSSPGANSDMNGATFEKDDTASDFVVDPTLTADEIQAGDDSAVGEPSLPDATTVAIPAERSVSMIAFSGSASQYALNEPPPRLMLTDAMLRVPCTAYTRSRPAMRSEVYAPTHGVLNSPQSDTEMNLENTCTAMSWAPGATPENVTPAVAPSPAAIPATCVPWKQPCASSGQGTAAPGPTCSSAPLGQNVVLCLASMLE